uniref:NADH-ubiquinone oxidoreductase chain 4L n=1 Tax=Haemodracon trachyrhinus TaxID=1216929 RepID=A0A7R7G371_9SAUR|nr:NADH dehydrogenase subunit 4L [Haemodracon trachyrhinus]
MTLTHYTTMTTFTLSLLGLILYRKHLVSALLCIESMMLALFLTLTTISQTTQSTNTALQPIILLAFSACGAAAGLSLLIASARTHASDHLNNLNLLKC